MGILDFFVRGNIPNINEFSSSIICDPQSDNSPTNCNYGQYNADYAARTQTQKDLAFDSDPGVTCGVIDPTLRQGTSMSRDNYDIKKLQDQLSNEIKDKLFGSKTTPEN